MTNMKIGCLQNIKQMNDAKILKTRY